jgi:ATP-dependent protease ClpP protease subunit
MLEASYFRVPEGSMINLERTVAWFGGVNEDEMKKVFGKIVELYQKDNKEPIYLVITSGGGSTVVSFAFYDLITACNINLVTICAGHADSAAIVIFLAGKERLATEHSTMEIHESEVSFSDPRRGDEVNAAKKYNDIGSRFSAEIVNRQTGGMVTAKTFHLLRRDITILTADEMLELGIATDILKQ